MIKGFTLVELAIVLVIIGLLVAGVLQGQELIRQSRIRSVYKQVQQYHTATETFRLKYNCLPGDCSRATAFFSATNNGNGNDKIGINHADIETLLFWQHLNLAGLIPGSYTTTPPASTYQTDVNFPSSVLGGGFGTWNLASYNAGGAYGSGKLFPADYGNNILLGEPWGDLSSKIPLKPALSGYNASEIDMKYDDGLPSTGNIITWMNSSAYSGGCATTDVAATAVYNNTLSITCALFFLNAF